MFWCLLMFVWYILTYRSMFNDTIALHAQYKKNNIHLHFFLLALMSYCYPFTVICYKVCNTILFLKVNYHWRFLHNKKNPFYISTVTIWCSSFHCVYYDLLVSFLLPENFSLRFLIFSVCRWFFEPMNVWKCFLYFTFVLKILM